MFAVLLAYQGPLNFGGIPSISLEAKNGKHRAAIEIRAENFKARGRRVVWRLNYDNGKKVIKEGRFNFSGDIDFYLEPVMGEKGKEKGFLGHDGVSEPGGSTAAEWLAKHDTEIVRLDVTVDGKKWAVGKTIYEDLHQVDLDSASASVSPDGKTVRIVALASDGAGGYQVTWAIRSNGKHTRDIWVP